MRVDQDLMFRDGALEDAEALARIGSDTFVETFGHTYRREDLDRHLLSSFSKEALEEELASPGVEFRIALSGRRMVAYAKIGPVRLPVDTGGREALELHRLYVRTSEQGIGVGRILLTWAINRARQRGAQDMYLGVWQENEHAIAVYQSRQFEIVGEYKYRVGDQHDDEFIMKKSFD